MALLRSPMKDTLVYTESQKTVEFEVKITRNKPFWLKVVHGYLILNWIMFLNLYGEGSDIKAKYKFEKFYTDT